MKISRKTIFKTFLLLVGLFLLILLCSFLNHHLNIQKELKYLKKYDTGQIIEVDHHKVNYKIFNEKNKEKTILLMGGSGINDLSLSFAPLAENINAKIILINRPGYGSSSDTKKRADITYIVDFYRHVLKELNITNKIILMPHSLSGMYAMYWAELYPEEIESIIGLDIGSPYMYVNESPNKIQNTLTYFGSKLGFHRFIYKIDSPNTAIKNYDIYDLAYFKAIWSLNMINPSSKFNLSEENLIIENAQKVINNMNDNYHRLRKLFIIANSISGNFYEKYEKVNLSRYYQKEEDIQKYIANTLKNQQEEKKSLKVDDNTSFADVEGPHLIYYYPTPKLIETINQFLNEPNQK